MKWVVWMKKVFGLAMMSVSLLVACSNNTEHFASQEEAVNALIEQEQVKGVIDLIETTNDDTLLVVETRPNAYFVAELLHHKKGYYTERRSDNVVMEMGGAWEITSAQKNDYTIYITEENDTAFEELALNYVPLSNGDDNVALLEGHTTIDEYIQATNAIENIEPVNN